ncbi:MAG: transposase [Armatimonadota bacterium]
MPRTARIVLPGLPHHITQRGNRRQDVFLRDEDRETYLALLVEKSIHLAVALSGYCLMTNHVHLVSTPPGETALARVIGSTHLRYTLLLNAREGWQGHLWQNRFFSAPLDETYYWRALRYVELNPVRAGLVSAPEDYPWSSAAVHLGLRAAPTWLDLTAWAACWTPASWRAYLYDAQEDAAADLAFIRDQTYLGRPLGSPAFVQQVEQHTGRRLQYGPAGRPKTVRGENEGRQ